MRGGPSTGMPTGPSQSDVMQARWGTHGDHAAIAIAPASCQEIFAETVRAFNLAETYRMPVQILMDEIVAHMREKIVFPEPGELAIVTRQAPFVSPAEYKPFDTSFGDIPPLAAMGGNYRYHVTGLNKAPDGFPTTKAELVDAEERRQLRKVEAHAAAIEKNEEYLTEDAEVIVLSFGITSRSARFAVDSLRQEGWRALSVLSPVPSRKKGRQVPGNRAIAPEMNLGQLVYDERVVKGSCRLAALGRVDGEPITPYQIIDKVKEVL